MTTRHSEAAAKKCRGSSVLTDPRCCWDEPADWFSHRAADMQTP